MPSRPQLANAIRALSMDAVQRAKSGHPGMPMGMADIAEVLWNDVLNHNPNNPSWANRDRFVLSNGHGSMLLYSVLHLSGYALSLNQIKRFRQLNSETPGHPERGDTPGVETTTGPLGQGLANAVGMAIAESQLAAQFNQPNFNLIDHHTYVFIGDGCLMEGISHEACSLAGTLGLGKLIVFYDDNGISIDGQVEGWFTDNTPERFNAYHWQVIPEVNGHDPDAIKKAILQAQQEKNKPTLICCKTIIGYGSPNLAGSEKTHGAPLGDAEIALTKQQLKWPYAAFEIPDEIYASWNAKEKGIALEQSWQQMFDHYAKQYPELSKEFIRRMSGDLPLSWNDTAQSYVDKTAELGESIATRKASQNCLAAYGSILPELIGGSADLAGSNNTTWSGSKVYDVNNRDGNYINYGVREFAMSAIMNGLAVHGGFIPYGGTFLVFCDYARNAVRLSALMKQKVIYVLTHDSIGLGEDGPTHQPIEHISMLRMTPNLTVWRPCDAVESAVAWRSALENDHGPSALLFSRQSLSHQPRDKKTINAISRGGYVLHDCNGVPDILLIATGSEVALAVAAANQLTEHGRKVRVISMPSTELFCQQDKAYQSSVLPENVTARLAIEAASSDYWYKFVGLTGDVVGIDQFGISAPANDVYKALGITVENIVDRALTVFDNNQ